MLVDPEGEPSLTFGLLPRYRVVVLTLSKYDCVSCQESLNENRQIFFAYPACWLFLLQ